jgi:hypothetical protein
MKGIITESHTLVVARIRSNCQARGIGGIQAMISRRKDSKDRDPETTKVPM